MTDPFTDRATLIGWEIGQSSVAGPRSSRPKLVPAWAGLERMNPWLDRAVEAAARAELANSSAAEWILDNAYIVQRAILSVQEDLPEGFYRRLRPLAQGAAKGEPRIVMLAHGLLAATEDQISRGSIEAFLSGFQQLHALDIAELWALPAVLRLACLERLTIAVAFAFGSVPSPLAPSESCRLFAPSAEPAACVGRAIANLVILSKIDWKEVFDHCSTVDRLLRDDPSGVYAKCDFDTRDTYRRSLERLADLGNRSELDVARAALALAGTSVSAPQSHVGFWLTARGLPGLEHALGIRPPLKQRLARWLLQYPGEFYAMLLFACGMAGLAAPTVYLVIERASPMCLLLGLALSALPATVLAVTLVNWLVTLTVPPYRLPKLDFSDGIDRSARTVVVMPVILGSVVEAKAILDQLVLQRLANPEAYGFVLLSDPVDADQPVLASDRAVEQALCHGIVALNREWGGGFCLMHRGRQHNRAQGCWMAWERKRGKIEQFNHFLMTGDRSGFSVTAGKVQRLVGAPFVVTADADTRLPQGSVAQLAGTLAHPLNRPVFGPNGRVVGGYTVLQPRVEIGPHASATRFARLFGGDSAIDIYSRAVSDVYQDLTGTGNYVGKGIYDVAAFTRSLSGRVPENLLLSHDLWEGLHGRAALVSDIVVYEGFPASYAEYLRRWHRWVRGDWQLLPWLWRRVPGPQGQRLVNRLSAFDRLRIWDNMRRSLVPPATLLLLLAGWFVLPGSPFVWTTISLTVPSAWLFTDLVTGMARGRRRGVLISLGQAAREHFERWLLQLAFMPADSLASVHAITVTLGRLARGQNLLEWSSAAQVSRLLARSSLASAQWTAAWPAPLTAVAAALALAGAERAAWFAAAPMLVLWALAPWIARWTALPRRSGTAALSPSEKQYLRQIARKSWLYFERFAGRSDHWLPPDNHQEGPVAATANRTSPTNIGMMALSALSAWRMGHLGSPEFALRMELMLDSVERLEKWHGHLLNWYDTTSLMPLEPRYVSTVDSGNLAVCLVVLANGCREIANRPIFDQNRLAGFADCLALLETSLFEVGLPVALSERVARLQTKVNDSGPEPMVWKTLFDAAREELSALRGLIVDQIARMPSAALPLIESVRDWLERSEHHVGQCLDELARRPTALPEQLETIARRASDLAAGMDFRPLYDHHRHLFHIGYDLTGERLDPHLYDLLASEARLASYFAIAKRDVPPEHWFQLGRPVTRSSGRTTLISWNGSMFEYLMPSLFVRSHSATLLGMTEREVVAIQQDYAFRHRVPWGISESGFAAHGSDRIWRYRAFGVPSIGLRRGLEEDLVIAPYAAALALPFDPGRVVTNLQRIAALGALGRYGFHEAIDFTPARRTEGGGPRIVPSYMAHHHGMTISAIANAVADDAIVRWFSDDPRFQSADLLLHERVPWEVPPERERLERLPTPGLALSPRPRPRSWEVPDAGKPLIHLLGNGRLTLRIGSDGCGDLGWHDHCVTVPAGRDRSAGHFLYLREPDNDSATADIFALPHALSERRIVIHPHKLEARGDLGPFHVVMDVLIAPKDDVEIRRLRIGNAQEEVRELAFASHADLALVPEADWYRHPAFARIFIEADGQGGDDVLSFKRRPRDRDAPGIAVAQRLITPGAPDNPPDRDVSRRRTRGRWGSHRHFPRFNRTLTEIETYPLDAAAALGKTIQLPPQSEIEIAVVTAVASAPQEALELLHRYSTMSSIDWTDREASETFRDLLARCDLPADRLTDAQCLFSALASVAGPGAQNAQGRLGDLWGVGLSGALPILLYEPEEQFDGADLRFLVGAHRLWTSLGARIDLVILYPGAPGYIEPVRERILEIVRESEAEGFLGQSGGITLVACEQANTQRAKVLRQAARAVLRGPLAEAMDNFAKRDAPAVRVPAFVPVMAVDAYSDASNLRPTGDLTSAPGFTDANDYRFGITPGHPPTAPWANVIANTDFGTIVTDGGLGFTFSENSGEHRLTPWHNDPLSDLPGEALYLRDEATGEIWSATPLPAAREAPWQVEHGAGWSRWRTSGHGLDLDLHCMVAADDPVKIVTLRLQDRTGTSRRLTATYFADLLLGVHPAEPHLFRGCRYRPDLGAILGQNPDYEDLRLGHVFLACSGRVHSLTTSRSDFLGAPPDWERPQGLIAWGLGERGENTGPDAAAALQQHLDIAPGQSIEVSFFLGTGATEDELSKRLGKLRQAGTVTVEQGKVADVWASTLGALQVRTPDPAFDVMVNRWLPYQAISSRLLARAGYYQASGAYGYRDQLQDVTALLLCAPDLARQHILRAAAQQFEEGDVLHWWHPPSGKGVRTRCSDDLLWLPFAAAQYVAATGDSSILDEEVTFLSAPELTQTEKDRYGTFVRNTSASLHTHCLRAFARAYRIGSHGLPLIGDGDWNDGMNRIGAAGRGESVWLAWFMADTIRSFAAVGPQAARDGFARAWLPHADQLIAAAEQHAWDGAWYIRAFDDFGLPWGSHGNDECRIDAIAQAWAVIAGANGERARTAVDSAFAQLVQPSDKIVRLLDPPFSLSARDPGYIMAYPPGIRENGGQYSHGAAWLGIACAMLGDGARAKEIFDRLNPAKHTSTPDELALYGTEPYAMAADISGGTSHLGRGGWTWYTGAAGWSYRLATEHILGIRLEGGRIRLAPCLPPDWDGYHATLRGKGTIALEVRRTGKAALFVNDEPCLFEALDFPGVGKDVRVRLEL
jgi:cyclic beta-1,2-glucan synthetase